MLWWFIVGILCQIGAVVISLYSQNYSLDWFIDVLSFIGVSIICWGLYLEGKSRRWSTTRISFLDLKIPKQP